MEIIKKETDKDFCNKGKELCEALDIGLDDMEKDRLMPHEDAMQIVWERLMDKESID